MGRSLAVLLTILLLSLPGWAQQGQKKLKAASIDGTTGLFKTWDAETLRQGEFNFSFAFNHYNRDPGALVIKTVPAALAFGLHDRFEVFGGIETQRRVTSNNLLTYRVLPGQTPRPAQLRNGAVAFSNEAPFMDVQRGQGLGDIRLGMKANIFSERTGSKLGLAAVGYMKAPSNREYTYLNRGLGTGMVEWGYGLLISKRAGNVAQFHLNAIMNFVRDPSIFVEGLGPSGGPGLVDLQNSFIYRAGAAWPTYGRFQAITELEGQVWAGSKTQGLNPRSPIDLIFGMRGYLTDYLAASVAYRATMNKVEENAAGGVYPAGTHGWIGQLAVGRRRNDPPTATCSVANPSIKQDETTAVRVSAVDPDQDALTYTWSTSGGKVTGTGESVTFDATGVAPGEYTITATVSDGNKHEVSCTARVNVIKKNLGPSVTCSPGSTRITQGESATIRADARDPNNDTLKYAWTVNGQALAADTPTVTFGTTGRAPGTYTVAVTVSDGELTASCSSSVVVAEAVRPNRPPVIECLTSSLDLLAGSSVELRARASDPDNDRVTITWSTSAGSISGSGETVTLNSTGMKAGIFTVTATVDDGRGGRASCTATVNVTERIRLVCEGKARGGEFAAGGMRIDNCAKAILDDIATRMRNEQRLYANVIGYTDGSRSETRAKKLGERRAKAAVKYLEKKGADISRITVTDGGDKNPVGDNSTSAGRKTNRRIEVELTVK